MKHLLLVLVLCALGTCVSGDPALCGNNICPPSREEQIAPLTVLRTYTEKTNWLFTSTVCSTEQCISSRTTEARLYMKIDAYIHGFNSKGESASLNGPLGFSLTARDDGKTRIRMYYYLSMPDPPQPIENTVSLGSMPAGLQFYARTFCIQGRRVTIETLEKELEALKDTLDNQHRPYVPNSFGGTAYLNQGSSTRTCYEVTVLRQTYSSVL